MLSTSCDFDFSRPDIVCGDAHGLHEAGKLALGDSFLNILPGRKEAGILTVSNCWANGLTAIPSITQTSHRRCDMAPLLKAYLTRTGAVNLQKD